MIAGKTDIMPDFCNRRYPFHYITALNLLAAMGIDINRIDILAVGEYENYKGEIIEQSPKPGEKISSGTQLRLKVGFSSPVDYMPYQFFYGLYSHGTSDGSWEDGARALMAPYDGTLIRYDARANYQKLKYNLGIIDQEHLLRILKLFKIDMPPHSNTLKDILFWLSVLPTFHFWAGNPDLVSNILHNLFGYEFKFVENCKKTFNIPSDLQYKLGAKTGRLGCETLVGRSFTEADSSYQLRIENVPANDVRELLPGGKKREKIDWLLGFCMPGNLEYDLKVRIKNSDRKERTESPYLGYSVYI
ncbi:MAG: type VI secretion system baseplate subunit TssG [Candidatus Zixiibacteriota bacterium]